jgi:hypothetical protein
MRILIWGELKNGGPYDVFRRLDYQKVYDELVDSYQANTINVGNKVWIQGIISVLSTPENELYFLDPNETWEEINSKYDKIVYSAANMLSRNYLELIDTVASIFRHSKIPVYVISIGAQANSYDEIDQLVKDTAKSVAGFMDSIYMTGGEISCRGYFTKEYLDKVARNSAVVTGCPSLFQNGEKLEIVKKDEPLLPVFNGNAPFVSLLNEYKESVYIDQDAYLNLLYDLHAYNPNRYLANSISRYGIGAVSLYLNGRIKCFYDMPEWRAFLREKKYNFSIGSRIHGTIMSILSGIPSVILPIDSRTREMAEFYHIPTIKAKDDYYCTKEVYDLVSFDEFNKGYPKLYETYSRFLRECGLVHEVNKTNAFWDRELPCNVSVVEEKRKNLKKTFENASVSKRLYFKLARKFPIIASMKETEQRFTVEKYGNNIKGD